MRLGSCGHVHPDQTGSTVYKKHSYEDKDQSSDLPTSLASPQHCIQRVRLLPKSHLKIECRKHLILMTGAWLPANGPLIFHKALSLFQETAQVTQFPHTINYSAT